MELPSKIIAGDKFTFLESNSDYKASDGWTAKYKLLNSSGKIEFASTPDDDDHSFSLTSAITASWVAGKYEAYLYFDNGVDQEIQEHKQVEVGANPLLVDTLDTRTHARKTLEAIEATIERRASKEQLSISIQTRNGSSRALQLMSMDELIKARAYYNSLVQLEDQQDLINQGKAPGNKILLSFK